MKRIPSGRRLPTPPPILRNGDRQMRIDFVVLKSCQKGTHSATSLSAGEGRLCLLQRARGTGEYGERALYHEVPCPR